MGADSQAVHRPAEPFPGEGDFDPTRVLLVEDNEVNCKVALNMLCKLGISVELVHDGLAAVQATARERFAAVLMDCQMPVMDGYEATAAIRERERADGSTRLPIVAMTANAMKGDHERCISAGMDDYISKPFKRDGLETVLRKWLSSNTRSNAVVETTTNASAPGRDPLDRPTIEELRELLEEEFDELIETYIEDAPSRIEKLASAAQVGDTEAVYQCAHSLKSSSANVGALELSAIARNLEELSRSGTVPGSDLLEQAQQEARQVLDALENLTSGRSAA
jgi:CheY-like chemotaxis protein